MPEGHVLVSRQPWVSPNSSSRKWLPSVDLHHDKAVNSRSCYFDTTREWRVRRVLPSLYLPLDRRASMLLDLLPRNGASGR